MVWLHTEDHAGRPDAFAAHDAEACGNREAAVERLVQKYQCIVVGCGIAAGDF